MMAGSRLLPRARAVAESRPRMVHRPGWEGKLQLGTLPEPAMLVRRCSALGLMNLANDRAARCEVVKAHKVTPRRSQGTDLAMMPRLAGDPRAGERRRRLVIWMELTSTTR